MGKMNKLDRTTRGISARRASARRYPLLKKPQASKLHIALRRGFGECGHATVCHIIAQSRTRGAHLQGPWRASLRFCTIWPPGPFYSCSECRIQPRFAVTDHFGLRSRASGILDCGVSALLSCRALETDFDMIPARLVRKQAKLRRVFPRKLSPLPWQNRICSHRTTANDLPVLLDRGGSADVRVRHSGPTAHCVLNYV